MSKRLGLFVVFVSLLFASGAGPCGVTEARSIFDEDDPAWVVPPNAHPLPVGPPPATAPAPQTDPPLARKHEDDAPAPRLPIPAVALQAECRKKVKAEFAALYAEGKPVVQEALGRRLMKLADTADAAADAVRRFVLLREAADAAARGGDVAAAVASLRALARLYDFGFVDSLPAVFASAANSKDSSVLRAVADSAIRAADQALAEMKPDVAVTLGTLAQTSARRAKDPGMESSAAARLAVFRESVKLAAAANGAKAKLASDTLDPKANFDLGAYRCFVLHDWKGGLPFLARGADPVLKALAETEALLPVDPSAQLRLANGWWDAGGTSYFQRSNACHIRAARWYRFALPKLPGPVADPLWQRLGQVRSEGRVTNLARLVQTFRMYPNDPINGDFSLAKDGLLHATGYAVYARALCPQPREYDLRLNMDVGFINDSPVFSITFPLEGFEVSVNLSGGRVPSSVSGLIIPSQNPGPLKKGHHVLVLRVRDQSLAFEMDGRETVHLLRAGLQFGVPGTVRNDYDEVGALKFMMSEATLVFQDIELIDLSGGHESSD